MAAEIEVEIEQVDVDASEAPDSQEKFRSLKGQFEDAIDHSDEFHVEAHKALRFYNNSLGTGQWDQDDLGYLKEQGRPAFSFNITSAKVNDLLGLYSDAQRHPKIGATAVDDKLLAEVLNAVATQVMEDANAESLLGRMLKTGIVTGECGMHVEVKPHESNPGWVTISLFRVMPFELHWDQASIEPDRSDAQVVFWDRWLSKREFNESYPDSKAYQGQGGDSDSGPSIDDNWGNITGEGEDLFDDYDDAAHSSLYYDRHRNKIRVVRAEYKEFVDRFTATDLRTGQSRDVGPDDIEQIQVAASMGMPIQLKQNRVEVVKVMEFCGTEILAEYDSAGPFDGFSLVSFAYEMDEETGTPYGVVRNLFDAQQEINKARSLSIEHMAQSVAVGTTAEEGAVLDEDQFKDASRQPGAVRIVKKDALVEGRVRDNVVSPPNAAAIQREQSSINLFHEISGVPSTADVTPAAQAQAATTVAIRYNKARQSVSQPIAHYEIMLRSLMQRIAETIVRAMPDDQIESILSSPRFKVQEGVIYEIKPQMTPQGMQPMPAGQTELRRIRDLNWNIEMQFTSDSSSLRLVEFQSLQALASSGVPVKPSVLIERAVSNRADQEELKAYAEQYEQTQSQISQQQMQMQQQQIEGIITAEAMKSQVAAQRNQIQAMDNQMDSTLERRDQDIDALLKLIELFAGLDDAQKARMFEAVRAAQAQSVGLLQ
jgi:hypothetical protein